MYANPFWLLFVMLCVAVWLYATSWVSEDAQALETKHRLWTSIMLGAGFVGAAAMLGIHPALGVAMLTLVVTALIVYIVARNELLPQSSRVTFGTILLRLASLVGIRGKREATDKDTVRLSMDLSAEDGTTLQSLAGADSELREGAEVLADLVARAAMSQSDAVGIAQQEGVFTVRFLLDGLWHDVFTFEPAVATSAMKCAANLARLEAGRKGGQLYANIPGEEKTAITVRWVRTASGIGMTLALPDHTAGCYKLGLETLGMHPELKENLDKVIGQQKGALFVTGPAESGKTTTLYAAVNIVDIFTTEVVAIEEEPLGDLGQVKRRRMGAEPGKSLAELFESALREEPNIVVVDELKHGEGGKKMLQWAAANGMIMATLKANHTMEALRRLAGLGIEGDLIAETVVCVTNQRLVRKLCNTCREQIEPSAKILQQLKIDPDNAGTWYRPVGCARCLETGYVGRVGIFEMLILNDEIRQLLGKGEFSAETISKAAGPSRLRTLHQDGLIKIRQGLTTLQEVRRVVKQPHVAVAPVEET